MSNCCELKYAIIGCGRISPNHFAAAQANGLQIAAVSDVVPERMQKQINDFNLPEDTPRFKDYRELLKTIRPDLVAICTESGLHAAIALDCLHHGANLIIEKPIALSLEDADAIIELARQKNLTVSACHQNRFNKSIRKIREAVEAARFGRMFYGAAHVRWNRGKEYYDQARWRGTWEQDGGALMNQCIHNIDLLRWMLGDEIEEVFAFTDRLNHNYIEAEDMGLALVRFKSGTYGLIEGTTDVFPRNLEESLYLFGERGTVKAGGKSVNVIEEWLFSDGLDDAEEVKRIFHENPPNVYGFGHTPLYRDVIDAIAEGRLPYVTAEDGRRALELVLAIYQSAALNKPVRFPLTQVSTLDFVGRFD